MTSNAGPVFHHVTASREAREFADRVIARARKAQAYPSDLWIVSYLRRYRSLTGRVQYAGPARVRPTRRTR
jgi:hypothetical protein